MGPGYQLHLRKDLVSRKDTRDVGKICCHRGLRAQFYLHLFVGAPEEDQLAEEADACLPPGGVAEQMPYVRERRGSIHNDTAVVNDQFGSGRAVSFKGNQPLPRRECIINQ